MKVKFLDLSREYKITKKEFIPKLLQIFENQSFILGDNVSELEKDLSKYLNVEDTIGVSSGTDALLISLMSLGIGPGDEVILPSFTFFATASSVVRLGAKPVFADIDPISYNISSEEIEKKINYRTKCIIPVHLYGNPADMESILEVSKAKNLYVIEDNAQAIGSVYKGRFTGSMGIFGCLSFYPTKNLGGAGDGGAITTNDKGLGKKVRMIRAHGSERRYYHEYIGINGRLDEIQAAYVRIRLRRLDINTQERIKIAETYSTILKDLEDKEYIVLPVPTKSSKHVFHQYTVRVLGGKRDKLFDFLRANNIGCEIYYPLPLHLQKCFSYLGYKEGDLPNTEKAAKEVISLPIYPGLRSDEIDFVCETIKKLY